MQELTESRVDRLLAALADPTRRAIVDLLRRAPRRAGEIQSAFPIADPAISRHLRILREAGLIVERRVATDGRIRLYELDHSALHELAAWATGGAATLPRVPGQDQLDAFRDYVAVRATVPQRSTP